MKPIYCSIVVIAICGLFGPAAAAQLASKTGPFNYFANDWNVVGLKDYTHGSRVTPENELLLGGRTAIRVRLGRELAPLSQASPKLAMHGWMPIILLRAGALRSGVLGHAAAGREGLAEGVRLADRGRELLELDSRQGYQLVRLAG